MISNEDTSLEFIYQFLRFYRLFSLTLTCLLIQDIQPLFKVSRNDKWSFCSDKLDFNSPNSHFLLSYSRLVANCVLTETFFFRLITIFLRTNWRKRNINV